MADERELIEAYREAFNAANGYEIMSIRYERGWFHIRQKYGSLVSKYRRAKLIEMTETLRNRTPPASQGE